MNLRYEEYLDKVLGGWIGKSIGGTLGAHHEGIMTWIDLSWEELIPATIPPNDDLDIQVLWLKVLEEKGHHLRSDDLARAWLSDCWYHFNEYGNFRRNWRNGIKPPFCGLHDNPHFDTGMGCPIRSEIWGYVFPGRPEDAARFARIDGQLDHSEQAIGAEQMFSAMAADAFKIGDCRELFERHRHYMPRNSPIERMVNTGVAAFDGGIGLKHAWERVLLTGGFPEPCDTLINVPFTIMALLYGGGDLKETILCAARLGYDTDCTMATAGALIGQIRGASGIPEDLRKVVGDQLVMGIEYSRPEMRLSALARDTVAVGLRIAGTLGRIGDFAEIPPGTADAPFVEPAIPCFDYEYPDGCAVAPGRPTRIRVRADRVAGLARARIQVKPPAGWRIAPELHDVRVADGRTPFVEFSLSPLPETEVWPQGHRFEVELTDEGQTVATDVFGFAGTMLWRTLGVFFDPFAGEGAAGGITREQLKKGRTGNTWGAYYVADLDREYLPDVKVCSDPHEADTHFAEFSAVLGRPAVVECPDCMVDLSGVIGLTGDHVAYLDADLLSPAGRGATLFVGASFPFKVYLNGALVASENEFKIWYPYSYRYEIVLRAGWNRLLLKLKRSDPSAKFSFAIRYDEGTKEFPNRRDWSVDLKWRNAHLTRR